MFSDNLLKKSLAFRGGTALHKLYLQLPSRYSEDIDLVQINSELISPILKRIRERLLFLGMKRVVKQHIHNNTIVYRFESKMQPIVPMRLKIEINTREHLNVYGFKPLPYYVQSGWFTGQCNVTGYELEELLATKLRALYQRKKGRDLFDLYWAIMQKEVDIEKLISCYKLYITNVVSVPPTNKLFLANMTEKMSDKDFREDVYLLLKKDIKYDIDEAWELIKNQLIAKI